MSSSPLELVRSTTEWVMSQASHVAIDDAALCIHVGKLISSPPLQSKWRDYPAHYYKAESDLVAQYVLVLDSLNFCFWPNKNIEYEHLSGALRRVLEADEHAFDGGNLAHITKEKLSEWLGMDFPLLDERVRLLREVGASLVAHFDGQASHLIRGANGSASKLVELVTAYFPGFRDHCVYKGKQVFMYKRVQIFVGDVWGAYEGNGLGKFADIGELTMFPDYRVPQLLQHYGILKYSPELVRRLETLQEIEAGSHLEIEIRAASVQAIEKMRKLLKEGGRDMISVELDWLMWNTAEADLSNLPPHHRCLTIYY